MDEQALKDIPVKKILTPGDLSKIRGPIKVFECYECGCIFESDKRGYKIYDSPPPFGYGNVPLEFFNLIQYISECPQCDNSAFEL